MTPCCVTWNASFIVPVYARHFSVELRSMTAVWCNSYPVLSCLVQNHVSNKCHPRTFTWLTRFLRVHYSNERNILSRFKAYTNSYNRSIRFKTSIKGVSRFSFSLLCSPKAVSLLHSSSSAIVDNLYRIHFKTKSITNDVAIEKLLRHKNGIVSQLSSQKCARAAGCSPECSMLNAQHLIRKQYKHNRNAGFWLMHQSIKIVNIRRIQFCDWHYSKRCIYNVRDKNILNCMEMRV